jgi:hypothetical protein
MLAFHDDPAAHPLKINKKRKYFMAVLPPVKVQYVHATL